MFRLLVKSEFSAAHNLREYKGKCEELHGHNWKVEIVVTAKKADRQGLVIDFHEIKSALQQVLEELDHKYLNQLAYFKKNNPTSENLARYIYGKLYRKSQIANRKSQMVNGKLQEVTVWESDNCSATYSKR